MKQWKEKDLEFLIDPKFFPECIECGNVYFHKSGCGRGKNLSPIELNKRLNERLAEFEKKYGSGGVKIHCQEPHCRNMAAGVMHVFFHGTDKTAESWPVCWKHAYHEDSMGRESQFRAFT